MAAARYFAFTYPPSTYEFIFELTDEAKIAHALKVISGEERSKVHVLGRIVKTQQPYNPKWSFHLNPASIDFFEVAIEVCDAQIFYVEDHLDEACGAFLPGCVWCPWGSKVEREVQPTF